MREILYELQRLSVSPTVIVGAVPVSALFVSIPGLEAPVPQYALPNLADAAELGARPPLAGPLYFQIQELMRARIRAKEWSGGRYLPNEGDLAKEYGVSVGTMRKALDLLGQQNLIVRRQGLGTYVNDNNHDKRQPFHPWSLDASNKSAFEMEVLASRMVRPSASQISDLRMERDAKAIELTARCTDNGALVSLDLYLIPTPVLPAVSQVIASGFDVDTALVAPQLASLDLRIKSYIDQISATHASEHVAKAMALADRAPILSVIRTALDHEGQPIFLVERSMNLSNCKYTAHVHAP